jgi:hypothetical protein
LIRGLIFAPLAPSCGQAVRSGLLIRFHPRFRICSARFVFIREICVYPAISLFLGSNDSRRPAMLAPSSIDSTLQALNPAIAGKPLIDAGALL